MIAIGGSIPLLCLEGVPDLPGALRMRPVSRGNSRGSLEGHTTCRKTPIPWSTFDQNQTPLSTLGVCMLSLFSRVQLFVTL